jgi:Icc-related predicted phosphoesterase
MAERGRVAAIYDVHGNLPALEAVLQDIRQAGVDHLVVGGDVVPGPMPREALACLLDLDIPAQFMQGNGDRAVLEQMAGTETGSIPEEKGSKRGQSLLLTLTKRAER